MNDRIRELAMEHGYVRWDQDTRSYELNGDVVEFYAFAELIIKECLGDFKERIALRYQGSDKDRDIGYGMEIVYMDIADKFGVEE